MRTLTKDEQWAVINALETAQATYNTLLKRYSEPGTATEKRFKLRIARAEELARLFQQANQVDVT